jgi:formylglycine-generating enzyme required for sulfatase activity
VIKQLMFRAAFLVSFGLLLFTQTRAAIVIDSVVVGNAGNTTDATGFGDVSYEYRIGTYEVTNNQYAAFLNAVAATDTFALYNASMGSDLRGGIMQSGSSGTFTYTAKTDMGNKPVNYVSFWDAARFANWLHNNQPTGIQDNSTTEDGAYTLTATDIMNNTVTRNSGANWVVPTENEWYKAAYHKNDGPTGNYFDYPTSSDTAPTSATANATGDISNPGANVANYSFGANWNGSVLGNLTTVGSADSDNSMSPHDSASPYLTYDQAGNVTEWNETLVTATTRGIRGGNFSGVSINLLASSQGFGLPTLENSGMGFRVASVAAVPEPSPLLYGGAMVLGFLCWKRWAS